MSPLIAGNTCWRCILHVKCSEGLVKLSVLTISVILCVLCDCCVYRQANNVFRKLLNEMKRIALLHGGKRMKYIHRDSLEEYLHCIVWPGPLGPMQRVKITKKTTVYYKELHWIQRLRSVDYNICLGVNRAMNYVAHRARKKASHVTKAEDKIQNKLSLVWQCCLSKAEDSSKPTSA